MRSTSSDLIELRNLLYAFPLGFDFASFLKVIALACKVWMETDVKIAQ